MLYTIYKTKSWFKYWKVLNLLLPKNVAKTLNIGDIYYTHIYTILYANILNKL